MLTRQELQARKPRPEQFETQEAFEEALNNWQIRVGRLLSLTSPSLVSLQPSELMDEM